MSVIALSRPGTQATIARAVAWALWGAVAVAVLASAVLWVIGGSVPLPLSFARGAIGVAGIACIAMTYGTVGVHLASRLSRNPIGWLLLGVGVGFGLLTPVNLLIAESFEVARLIPTTTLVVAWLMSSMLTPVVGTYLVLVCMLFPDGHFTSGRWKIAAMTAIAGSIVLAVTCALDPTGLVWYPTLPNPAALTPAYGRPLQLLRLAGLLAIIVSVVFAAGSMIVRYRHASERVRLQLRWIVFGVAVMVAGLVPVLVARYAMPLSDEAGEMLIGIASIAVSTFPVMIAIAIVRQHLFDIDAIIGRTLVYVPLMGLLAGLYTASLAFFQRLFVSLTGNTSDAAIVVSSLILAGMFAPARSALEARVGRRFKPAEHIWRRADGEPIPLAAGSPVVPRAVAPVSLEAATPDRESLAARLAALEKRLAAIEERESQAGPAPPPDAAPADAG